VIVRPPELEELAKCSDPAVPKLVKLFDDLESFDERVLKVEARSSPVATLHIVDRAADSVEAELVKMSGADLAKALMQLTQQHPMRR
jgi:hypothetical protein